jgi:hypothetical protein
MSNQSDLNSALSPQAKIYEPVKIFYKKSAKMEILIFKMRGYLKFQQCKSWHDAMCYSIFLKTQYLVEKITQNRVRKFLLNLL